MIKQSRDAFNASFTPEKYLNLLDAMVIDNKYTCKFRIAETPIFIPKDLKLKLEAACESLADFICSEEFEIPAQKAIEKLGIKVPGEEGKPTFIQMDFGISRDDDGELHPYLVEMQGFPSLYLFQLMLSDAYKSTFELQSTLSNFPSGMSKAEYLEELREIMIGEGNPENTILLEIDPEKQNTAIDFYATQKELGIKVLDLIDLKLEGKDLYYCEGNRKIPVYKIYNRVIFDELDQRKDLNPDFTFDKPINAEWIGHPNWYFKISKYTMPYIRNNPFVPWTRFLSEIEEIPKDLENYVLKPLFSFSGTGVIFSVSKSDIDHVKDPENWVLQRKIKYSPVIQTPNPDEPVKCEVRMMHVWNKNDSRPKIVNNIVRLSKGDMIGVKYNKDKDWVGASCAFFE